DYPVSTTDYPVSACVTIPGTLPAVLACSTSSPYITIDVYGASGHFTLPSLLQEVDFTGTLFGWNALSSSCVLALAAFANGLLASGHRGATVQLWDTTKLSHNCIATLRGHANAVLALATLSGGLLASGSGDASIKLWDTSAL